MNTHKAFLTALATTLALGCSSEGSPMMGPDVVTPTVPGSADQVPGTATVGGEDNTFDHDNQLDLDPFEILEKLEEEGPAEFRSRVHSCPKVKYAALGSILASRGVDLASADPLSAGAIYRGSDQALGVANYGARVSESASLTTASASKLFDIFIAAAPEIIANMPTAPACVVGDRSAPLFNSQDQCLVDGVSCLIGAPASVGHLELCNRIVTEASTPERGKIIAVAALAAGAHTCE